MRKSIRYSEVARGDVLYAGETRARFVVEEVETTARGNIRIVLNHNVTLSGKPTDLCCIEV